MGRYFSFLEILDIRKILVMIVTHIEVLETLISPLLLKLRPAQNQSVIERASKKIAKDVLSAQGSVLAHVVFFSPTFLAKLVGLILNVFFDGPCSFDMHQT